MSACLGFVTMGLSDGFLGQKLAKIDHEVKVREIVA